MKALAFSVIIVLTCIFSFTLAAQTTATWKGGKPGHATDWNCPANWSKGHVPNEFTQVIIPAGANYYPVIQYTPAPIDALLMECGATLSIQEDATLTILCETGIFDGVTVLGQIRNDGILEIGESAELNKALLQRLMGKGIVLRPSASSDTLARQR